MKKLIWIKKVDWFVWFMLLTIGVMFASFFLLARGINIAILLVGVFLVSHSFLARWLPNPKQYDRKTKILLILFEGVVIILYIVCGVGMAKTPENTPTSTYWLTLFAYTAVGWPAAVVLITKKYRKSDGNKDHTNDQDS